MTERREIRQYGPEEARRLDNPEAGSIGASKDLDKTPATNTYAHDLHLDRQLRWEGEAGRDASASALPRQLQNEPKRLKAELDALEAIQVVEVKGFDYNNPKTGEVRAGEPGNIAMWMLDTDYNGRSVYPKQVFFPMAGKEAGWAKLAKSLKAELDEDLIEHYRGTVSLPFAVGKERTIAVKIIDDRGIESM